jgi:hypothetical protein
LSWIEQAAIQVQILHVSNKIKDGYRLGVKHGGNMISSNYDIEEFFRKIGGKQHFEAIELANQEAIMAERMLLSKKRSKNKDDFSYPKCSAYSQTLKEFIQYARCSVKPKILSNEKYQLFHSCLDDD